MVVPRTRRCLLLFLVRGAPSVQGAFFKPTGFSIHLTTNTSKNRRARRGRVGRAGGAQRQERQARRRRRRHVPVRQPPAVRQRAAGPRRLRRHDAAAGAAAAAADLDGLDDGARGPRAAGAFGCFFIIYTRRCCLLARPRCASLLPFAITAFAITPTRASSNLLYIKQTKPKQNQPEHKGQRAVAEEGAALP